MLRVDPDIAYHKLDINPNVKLVKQKSRCMNLDCRAHVQAEVDRLLIVIFIKEAMYPMWVSNIVAVLKRMIILWCALILLISIRLTQ